MHIIVLSTDAQYSDSRNLPEMMSGQLLIYYVFPVLPGKENVDWY